MGENMSPNIDVDECIGCGQCEVICPEVFEVLLDNLAHVIEVNITNDIKDKIDQAIEECPVSAISW
jgi:ferredoxin